MADQGLNREINLTLNENVTPQLSQIGQSWGELGRQIEAVGEQIAALDARLAQFKQTSTGAVQDLGPTGGGRFATGTYRQLSQDAETLRASLDQLRSAQADVAARNDAIAASSVRDTERSTQGWDVETASVKELLDQLEALRALSAGGYGGPEAIAGMNRQIEEITARLGAKAPPAPEEQTIPGYDERLMQKAMLQYAALRDEIAKTEQAEMLAADKVQSYVVEAANKEKAAREAAAQAAIAAAEKAAAAQAIAAQKVAEQATLNAARGEAQVQNLTRQVMQTSERLNSLSQQRPLVQFNANTPKILSDLAVLQEQVRALSGRPYDIQFRTDFAEARAQLATLNTQIEETIGGTAGAAHGSRFGLSFGHALQVSLLYGGAFQLISSIQNVLGGALQQAVAQPVAAESAITVYSRELGNATDARKRFNDVMAESQRVGIPDEDLVKLDQRLAQIGITSETAQARFGRSLAQVRKDLEDLTQVPGLTADQVQEFFTRSSDGANRLILSLKSAGVATTGELQKLGVVFNRQGTQILSDSNTTTSALLSLIEQKFGGLAEAQGQTLQGMEVRTKNTWDHILQIIGQPSVEVIAARMQAAVNSLSDPKNTKGLEDFGKRMAENIYLIGLGWDTLTQKIGEVIAQAERAGILVAAVIKQTSGIDLGPAAGQGMVFGPTPEQTSMVDALIAQQQQAIDAAARYGQTAASAFNGAADAVEVNRVAVQQLNDALDEARSKAQGAQYDYQAAVAPLKDTLDSVRQTESDRMASFDAMLKPLQAQKDVLQAAAQTSGEAYQTQIQGLQDKLSGIQESAQNISDKYQAAIAPLQEQERLLDRNYQHEKDMHDLADMDRNIARDKLLSVDIYSSEGRAAAMRLQDEVSKREDKVGEMQHTAQKNALEDQVRGLQAAQAAEERAVQNTERAYQRRIQDLENASKREQATYTQAERTLDARIKKIQDARSAEQEYFKSIEDNLQRQIDSMDRAYQQMTRGVEAVEHSMQVQIAALEKGQQSVATAGVDVLRTINGAVTQILNTIQAVFAIPDITDRQRAVNQPYGGGRAGGGAVDSGWYTVGEYGPEMLHAGGPGYVNAAQGMGGQGISGQITILGLDTMNRELFREMFTVERGFVDKQIVASIKGNRG